LTCSTSHAVLFWSQCCQCCKFMENSQKIQSLSIISCFIRNRLTVLEVVDGSCLHVTCAHWRRQTRCGRQKRADGRARQSRRRTGKRGRRTRAIQGMLAVGRLCYECARRADGRALGRGGLGGGKPPPARWRSGPCGWAGGRGGRERGANRATRTRSAETDERYP
jgi:hypothetical protein